MPKPRILICGCFDLLHTGHILLLKTAYTFGDIYVGVGDDESIRDLKGENRPILTEQERLDMVLMCRYVTSAKIFHFKTEKQKHYEELLAWSDPIAYAQGPDHAPEVLENILREKGIPVVVVPNKIQGTTDIEQKILDGFSKELPSQGVFNSEDYYFNDS